MNKIHIIGLIIIIFGIYYYREIIKDKIYYLTKKKENCSIGSPQYYLINVLDKKDFDDAHIAGSIHVPFKKITDFLKTVENKETTLIFYCSNYFCTSSDAAAKIAIKKGFKNVFVYKGGMAEWYQTAQNNPDFEYNGSAKAEYLQIVILPEGDILDPEVDIIDEENAHTEKFKIISINNLQNFLKEGTLRK